MNRISRLAYALARKRLAFLNGPIAVLVRDRGGITAIPWEVYKQWDATSTGQGLDDSQREVFSSGMGKYLREDDELRSEFLDQILDTLPKDLGRVPLITGGEAQAFGPLTWSDLTEVANAAAWKVAFYALGEMDSREMIRMVRWHRSSGHTFDMMMRENNPWNEHLTVKAHWNVFKQKTVGEFEFALEAPPQISPATRANMEWDIVTYAHLAVGEFINALIGSVMPYGWEKLKLQRSGYSNLAVKRQLKSENLVVDISPLRKGFYRLKAKCVVLKEKY